MLLIRRSALQGGVNEGERRKRHERKQQQRKQAARQEREDTILLSRNLSLGISAESIHAADREIALSRRPEVLLPRAEHGKGSENDKKARHKDPCSCCSHTDPCSCCLLKDPCSC